MMFSKNWILFILLCLFFSCTENTLPKPKGLLALKYPESQYIKFDKKIPFEFEYNDRVQVRTVKNRSHSLLYPNMKATLYLSYVPVTNNLDSLLTDAYKLPSKHISKAEEIPERVFVNPEQRVYGTLFKVVGNAASQLQFFLTDSTDHFMVGSLYFYIRPNYDSLLPALNYIEKDVIHLMETLKWDPDK